MAIRTGKATCFAVRRRLVDGWSLEELDRAMSAESLPFAADGYRQSMGAARKLFRPEFKVQGFAIQEPEAGPGA